MFKSHSRKGKVLTHGKIFRKQDKSTPLFQIEMNPTTKCCFIIIISIIKWFNTNKKRTKIWQANTRHTDGILDFLLIVDLSSKIKMIQNTQQKKCNETIAKTLFTNFSWFFLHETQWRIFFVSHFSRLWWLMICSSSEIHPFQPQWQHIGLFSTYDASFGNTIELLRNFIFKSHFRSRNRLLIGFNIISFNHPHNCQFNWNLNELTFSTLGTGALCAHMLCARERDEHE